MSENLIENKLPQWVGIRMSNAYDGTTMYLHLRPHAVDPLHIESYSYYMLVECEWY